jgi:hypothetical protein
LESGKSRLYSHPHRGMEQLVARWAHNPKVVSSSLAPATEAKPCKNTYKVFCLCKCSLKKITPNELYCLRIILPTIQQALCWIHFRFTMRDYFRITRLLQVALLFDTDRGRSFTPKYLKQNLKLCKKKNGLSQV